MAAVAVTAWSAGFLLGQWPATVLVPCGFALGCLLLWRHPVLGALAVCGTQATGLVLGVDHDNAAGLLPALLTLVVLGLNVPARTALPLVAAFLGVIVATGLSPVRTVVGLLFFTGTWLVARLVGDRRRHVEQAREHALALERRDLEEVSAGLLAAERRRLAVRSATSVGSAVEEMTLGIRDGLTTLDAAVLAAVRRRGEVAVAELRELLGLLRAPTGAVATQQAHRRVPSAPWRRDLVIAAGVCLLGLVELRLSEDLLAGWSTALLGVVGCGALALRRTAPMVAALWLAAVLSTAVVTSVPTVQGVAELTTLTLISWTALGTAGRTAAATLLIALAAVAAAGQRSLEHAVVAGSLLALVTVTALVWRRLIRDHAAATGRVRVWEARLREIVEPLIADERARLVRELHDVASHSLGVILLQLGAAEATRLRDPAAARAALEAALAVGDDAKHELDTLAGRLEPATRRSFAGEVSLLVARLRAGGVRIEVRRLDELAPGASADTAYRVIQEGLTNVLKHAPGAAVDVNVAIEDGQVAIEIGNGLGPGPESGRASPRGSGLGLAGLSERVARLGGTLDAGPVDAGFRVCGRWPAPIAAVPVSGAGITTCHRTPEVVR